MTPQFGLRSHFFRGLADSGTLESDASGWDIDFFIEPEKPGNVDFDSDFLEDGICILEVDSVGGFVVAELEIEFFLGACRREGTPGRRGFGARIGFAGKVESTPSHGCGDGLARGFLDDENSILRGECASAR